MSSRCRFPSFPTLPLLLLILATAVPIDGMQSRKLDESSVPGTGDEKCIPCQQSSPPPPPPACPPPPPPPSPPPAPKKPPPQYCPPPPSSFIYLTGPPSGNLYPIDQEVNAAVKNSALGLLGFALLGLLAFW